MSKWKKEEFIKMSWSEFDEAMDKLWRDLSKHLKKNKLQVDAVVPLLRGAMVPAQFLLYRLDMLTVVPVQYKYFFDKENVKLEQIISFDKTIIDRDDPVLITVEDNMCYGKTSQMAIDDIKKILPKSKIIHCAFHADYVYFRKLKNAEAKFYGRYTNECRELSRKKCKDLGIYYGSKLLPWEYIGEEWTTVSGKQHKYSDLDKVRRKSKVKLKIEY